MRIATTRESKRKREIETRRKSNAELSGIVRRRVSELCALTEGVSRQPEGVTPAYSQAGSEKRRKRRTRDTSSFYGTRARFRTDNVDPIENAYASCLKAIDCFSNMSETAALVYRFLLSLPPPPFSSSHVEKFVSELYKCGFSECQCVTRTKIRGRRQSEGAKKA